MRSAHFSALSSPFSFPLMDLDPLNLCPILSPGDQPNDGNELAVLPGGLPKCLERLIGHKWDNLVCPLYHERGATVLGGEPAYRLEPDPGRRKPRLNHKHPQLLHLEGSAFLECDFCLRLLQTDFYFVHAFQAG